MVFGPVLPRHSRAPQAEKGKCRECGNPVPKSRRTLCSKFCAETVSVRSSGSYARWMVEKRDKGVCVECGTDTEAQRRGLVKLQALYWTVHAKEWHAWCVGIELQLLNWKWSRHSDFHLWEMDHIVPVSEGGGSCALDNLRTLCRPCHRAHTAGLRKRLAHERRRLKKHEAKMDEPKELVLTPPDGKVEPLDGIGKPYDPNPMVRHFGRYAENRRCKACRFLYVVKPGNRTFFKCRYRKETGGPGSDHRINWAACSRFEEGRDESRR